MNPDRMLGKRDQAALVSLADEAAALRAFGERIVRLRERRGWSRADLARQLGVARERVAKWELGLRGPMFSVLAPLARVLGVSLDELITGEPAGSSLTPAEQEKLEQRIAALRQWLR